MSERPIMKAEVIPGFRVELFVSIKEQMSGCWWCQVVRTAKKSSGIVDTFYLMRSGDDGVDLEQAKRVASGRLTAETSDDH